MKGWVLWVLLATGEAGPVASDETMCRGIPAALDAGMVVTAEFADGSEVQILEARCERAEDAVS